MQRIEDRQDALRRIDAMIESRKDFLPALPQILTRVQTAIVDPRTSARQLAALILEEPTLTAKVLKLANSAFYSVSNRPITTITNAIVQIGFEAIRNLVLSMKISGMLKNLPSARNNQIVWRHSLCTALCAQRLARKMNMRMPEEAFVSGLLHDIGKLVLAECFPEHYAQVLRYIKAENIDCLKAEKKLLRVDHTLAGYTVAKHWHFSQHIATAIRDHEFDERDPASSLSVTELVRVVRVANKLAIYMFGGQEGEPMVSFSEIRACAVEMLHIDGDYLVEVVDKVQKGVSDVAGILDLLVDPEAAGHEEVTSSSEYRQQGEQLRFLLKISESGMTHNELNALLTETIFDFYEVLRLQHTFLLFATRDRKQLDARFGFGHQARQLQKTLQIQTDLPNDVAARAFLDNAMIVVNATNMHEFSRLSETNLLSQLGTFNVVAAPIRLESKAVGVLVASRHFEHPTFTGEEARIVNSFSMAVSQVLARSYRRQKTGEGHALPQP